MAVSQATGQPATELRGERRLPPPLQAQLEQVLRPGEVVVHRVESDMNLAGRYTGGSWLVVSTGHLVAFDPAHPQGLLALALDEVRKVELRQLYGNVVLEARVQPPGAEGPTATVELLRFSRTLADEVSEIVDRLSKYLDRRETVRGDAQVAEELATKARDHQGKCRICGRRVTTGTQVCLACMNKRKLMLRSFAYLWRYRAAFLASFALTIALTFISLAPQYLTKVLVDAAILKGNLRALLYVIIAIIGTHAVSAALHSMQIYIMQWLGNKVIVDLRTEVYQQLQKLTLTFYDKRQTGWIMSRITNDTSFLQHFLVHGVQDIAVQLITLVAIIGILFAMDWQLAILALLPTPVVAWSTAWFSKRMHKRYHRIWRRVSNMYAMLGDTIPGIRVVKAFTQEDHEVGRFIEKNMEVFDENMRAVRITSWFWPAMGLTTSIGAMIIWAYGGYNVITNPERLTLGTLMAFIGYTGRFYQPIQQLSRMSEQVQGALTAAERLFEILDTQPEVEEGHKALILPKLRGAIEFRNVSFYYEKGEPVLQDINVKIEPGEMIGLVGSSGSGKTTMINLIARFYDVTDGQLLVDGVDIRDLDLRWLRSQIGMVLQEPFLFHGTIAENIAYGKPDATFEEIVQAAITANAHGFIMDLPDGYDTRIGERGIGLSGGEKQRISIARAILKNPRILILDEATSAVDTETEKLIQQAIDRLVEGRTTIAIAHRLSTLQNANRLLVLQDGRVVEEGTHAQLLAKEGGVFRKLVEMQTEIAKLRALA